VLESLFGDRQIEDLPLQYFCVSTNLTRSEVMVHRSGPLTKSVAASMAVPGLGPPIFDGRDVLVDGGVLNNLPIDIMRSLGRGPVIASSVSPWVVKRLDREYADLPSPWRVLFSRINPFGTPMRVPTIAGILMRSASLPRGSNEGYERRTADLLFEPPLARYKLLEWRSIDELIEIGYRSAVATLEKLHDSSTLRSTNLAG
jgi:predicted acylesterase/phospholipase RssA